MKETGWGPEGKSTKRTGRNFDKGDTVETWSQVHAFKVMNSDNNPVTWAVFEYDALNNSRTNNPLTLALFEYSAFQPSSNKR